MADRAEAGLGSVRAATAPFSAEMVALSDLLTIARAVEHDCDGPTEEALRRLADLMIARGEDWMRTLLRALLTAALLEASRS